MGGEYWDQEMGSHQMKKNDCSDKENAVNDQFDNWVREVIPAPEENEMKKEIHLAILKERLRTKEIKRRRQRYRYGMMVAPFLFVVLYFGNTVDLGGDGFDLVEVEAPVSPGSAYKNDFREEGFLTTQNDSSGDILELTQQIAAGEGTIIGLEGYEIHGKIEWSIIREYSVSGKIFVLGTSPHFPSSDTPLELRDFLVNEWSQYESRIEAGTIASAGQKNLDFDGIAFSIQYWTIPTEKFGIVKYYSGKPIH